MLLATSAESDHSPQRILGLCSNAALPAYKEAYQRDTQDLGEGVGGAAGRCEADGGIGGLKPGLLAGPHDVAEGQDGGAQAQRGPVDRHHDGLLKLDKGLHKVPGEKRRSSLTGGQAQGDHLTPLMALRLKEASQVLWGTYRSSEKSGCQARVSFSQTLGH